PRRDGDRGGPAAAHRADQHRGADRSARRERTAGRPGDADPGRAVLTGPDRSGIEKHGRPAPISVTGMTSIESLILEVADPTAADRFYTTAFGPHTPVRLRASEAPTAGFRGFTLSLTVSQPATVRGFVTAALDAGATALKPVAKSFWGCGGVVQAPDGTIWKIATSAKKDTGPATRQIDQIVLLLGTADVTASKRFYVDHGLAVAKSFGRKYVESAQAGPLRAPCPGQGRRRCARGHRIAPAHDRQRGRALHRPGRIRVGSR